MAELTKQAEDQLIRSIQDVVRLVDDRGLDPTDAVVKVADDGTWSPHFVRRMCEAYNIGRQEAQRKEETAVLSKFATFALADADKAIGRIFPTGLKKTAETISSDFSGPPTWLPGPPRVKTASILEKLASAEPQPQTQPDVTKLLQQVGRASKQAELCAQQVFEAKEHVKQALSSLGLYFRQAPYTRASFEVLEKVAELYYAPEAKSLLNYVHARHCSKEKRASSNTTVYGRLDRSQAPFTLLAGALQKVAALLSAQKEFASAAANHTAVFGKYLEAKDRILGPVTKSASATLGLSIFQEKSAGPAAMAAAAGFGAGVKSLADDALKALHHRPTSDQLVDKEWLALEDPAHDEELRKIRAQAMLTDFMTNDDVIAKHDPGVVLTKFNELQGMMPSLAAQPAAMRPYLRRALQGHMEPFEAHEMAKLQSEVQPSPDTAAFSKMTSKAASSTLELRDGLVLGK